MKQHKTKTRARKAFNLAYCGIMCAFALVIMFAAIIPGTTYLIPAVAGLIVWSVRSQSGRKWAVLAYAATVILSMLIVPEIEAKTFFALFFGYYPLLRETLHKIEFKPARLLLKLALFNAAAVSGYLLVVYAFGVADTLDGLEGFGQYAVYALWGAGNLAFLCYDFSLDYAFYAFRRRIKPLINKKLR